MSESILPQWLDLAPDLRCWVVRSDQGRFYENFLQSDCVAIGHLDRLGLTSISDINAELSIVAQLRKSYASDPEGSRPSDRTLANHASQARAFAKDIQLNDYVIALNSRFVSIGRVVSEAKFERSPILAPSKPGEPEKEKCMFSLRRKVKWGSQLERAALPLHVQHSLGSHLSVFNVDKLLVDLLCMVFPAVVTDSGLYLSLKVQREQPVQSRHLARIMLALAELDEPYARENSVPEEVDLTSRVEVMSPGHIWTRLGLTKVQGKRVFYALLIYFAIFGGKVQGYGFDGVLDSQMRHKLLEFALEYAKANKIEESKQHMQLKLPSVTADARVLVPADATNDPQASR